jgi:hypothetical protein
MFIWSSKKLRIRKHLQRPRSTRHQGGVGESVFFPKFRHPDSPGNRMSPPSTDGAVFEIPTTSREAAPTAVETRSEFRYRFEAAAPQKIGAAAPRSRGARPPRVHQHAPPRAELKKMRPQAGGCFDKSGARRTRQRPRAGALPETMREKTRYLKVPPRLVRPRNPPSKLVPSSATKSACLPARRSRIALDLRMAVALWAKRGSSGFPAMRKTIGRDQDV